MLLNFSIIFLLFCFYTPLRFSYLFLFPQIAYIPSQIHTQKCIQKPNLTKILTRPRLLLIMLLIMLSRVASNRVVRSKRNQCAHHTHAHAHTHSHTRVAHRPLTCSLWCRRRSCSRRGRGWVVTRVIRAIRAPHWVIVQVVNDNIFNSIQVWQSIGKEERRAGKQIRGFEQSDQIRNTGRPLVITHSAESLMQSVRHSAACVKLANPCSASLWFNLLSLGVVSAAIVRIHTRYRCLPACVNAHHMLAATDIINSFRQTLISTFHAPSL